LALLAASLLGWAGWSWLGVEPPPPGPLPTEPPAVAVEAATGPSAGETAPELRVTVSVRQVEEFLPSPGYLHEQLVGGPRRLGDPEARAEHHVVVQGFRGGDREVRAPFVDPAHPHKIASGPPMTARARILDAAGMPLAGATLWFGRIDAQDLPVVATADAEGRCEFATASGEGVPVVAKANGHASELRIVDLDVRLGELEFRLAPAAALRVQVVGAGPAAGVGQVFVVPLDRVTTELSVYPFLLGTVFGGVPLDARGRATIEDLPAECEVGVVFVHPAVALTKPRQVKVSSKGEDLVLQVRAVPTRQATVRDPDGRAIGGARLLAGFGPGPAPWAAVARRRRCVRVDEYRRRRDGRCGRVRLARRGVRLCRARACPDRRSGVAEVARRRCRAGGSGPVERFGVARAG
jgi:hypothetical protein